MLSKKMFLKECHLAGKRYYDADEVWNELKVGTIVQLVRDENNHHDAEAIAVMYQRDADNPDDVYHLGYIPSDENYFLSKFLDMGWGEAFECRISKLDPNAHSEAQVHLTIRLLKNNK